MLGTLVWNHVWFCRDYVSLGSEEVLIPMVNMAPWISYPQLQGSCELLYMDTGKAEGSACRQAGRVLDRQSVRQAEC